GSAFSVRTPPLGPSLRRIGWAKRAISGPAISVQRSTRVGLRKPARTKMSLLSPPVSRPTASGQLRRGGGGGWGSLVLLSCVIASKSDCDPAMAARQRVKVKARAETPAQILLTWYDSHRRVLPWRAKPGEPPDPYRVWLSEIMLQQTTVQAVARYYREFVERWPDAKALAATPLHDVLAVWAGLGYYARARNLHRAAKVVVDEFGGEFPASLEQLRKLPGVGAYTAGAIAAIAFDLPALA